ncbi:MAG TPA: endonuclease/exonuclease/phosphatase family protein [Kribbellaceae bacterium]|nr:endonuclease/exonuclease/phosphatase family protein [Kribbellaceae bacterium]
MLSSTESPPDDRTNAAAAPIRARRSNKWTRGWSLALLAVLTTFVLLFHSRVPNSVGNAGSLLETFLPWVGLAVPLIVVGAVVRRSATAAVAVLVPALIWAGLFGELVVPGKGGGTHNLRVLTHNVDVANGDHAGTARDLLAADADVVALEEMTGSALNVYNKAFDAEYPYRVKRSTVGLWSRYPIAESGSVDIGLSWTRALRAQLTTPDGDVAIYVAHLASVRIGSSGFTADQRNETIEQLGRQLADEKLAKVVLMGDLNGTANDRSLAPVTAQLRSAQGAAGDGFGFSWPAGFPMARIDHVLVRGVEPSRAWVLPRTGSDHRPVAADLRI